MSRRRLAYIVTHPATARFLVTGQLRELGRRGLQVTLIAAPGPDLELTAEREGVATRAVPMRRSIHPAADLLSLLRLWRVLARLRPDAVNASTPKAGLLGILAARLAGVPVRIYTLRGLRLETTTGWRRRLLALTERLACGAATRIVCVSPSLERRLLELGLADHAKSRVLGAGSSNGVDCHRFRPPADSAEVAATRSALGLPDHGPIVAFVGRMTRDKGIEDLARAFCDRLTAAHPEAWLLLLGEFEPDDPVAPATVRRLTRHPRVLRPGFVADSAPYYRAIDLLAFPSYREGFPNAPLEASASGLAVAGYAATGTVDAVVDGVTGTLAPTGDGRRLAEVIDRYLAEPELRATHGAAGRRRVTELFDREAVWERWAATYDDLLRAGS